MSFFSHDRDKNVKKDIVFHWKRKLKHVRLGIYIHTYMYILYSGNIGEIAKNAP